MMPTPIGRAREVLAEETDDGRRLDFDHRLADLAALRAAADLARHPRRLWARPRTRWESTVITLAVVLLRVEGNGPYPPESAFAAVRAVLPRGRA